MNTQTVENFYEIIGYVHSFSIYFVLLFFVIKPFKIIQKPFNYIFINTLLNIIFDVIALILHNTGAEEIYFYIILPFYAINNILFIGLFLSYHVPIPFKKIFQISTFIFSAIILTIYLVSEKTWSSIGSLFQSLTMISYLLITLNFLFKTSKKLPNHKPAVLITIGLLFAFTVSIIINSFYGQMLNEDIKIAHLFYGIKNIFWIIANCLMIYAVFLITPTATPKPSQLPPEPN